MKECELCESPARMYCESDQASLCWDCDAKVHGANFLVARHSRSLLCHLCQSPTPWRASGAKLGPTVSVCDSCVSRSDARSHPRHLEGDGENDDRPDDTVDDGDDADEEEDDGDEAADEGEEDGENQVVPWSSTPPPFTCSSSSDESTSRLGDAADPSPMPLKRLRENADLSSQDDLGCSSSQHRAASSAIAAGATNESARDEASSLGSFRPSKERKRAGPEPRSWLIDSLQRFQRVKAANNDDVLDICKLSKDPSR